MATLQEYYNQLNPIYAPQRALIAQQQAALPGAYTAQQSALEQAKINAFRDITNTASARGTTFSGFAPEQQAQYVGEKFLPAVAALKQDQLSKQFALTQALNELGANQSKEARNYYESAQQAEAANAAKIYAAQIAAQAKAASAATSAASKTASKFYAKDVLDKKTGKKTGTNFYGANKQPITAAQYYSGVGGSIDDLYNFLQNDMDKTSKKAAADLAKAGSVTPALVNKYPWIFGG